MASDNSRAIPSPAGLTNLSSLAHDATHRLLREKSTKSKDVRFAKSDTSAHFTLAPIQTVGRAAPRRENSLYREFELAI